MQRGRRDERRRSGIGLFALAVLTGGCLDDNPGGVGDGGDGGAVEGSWLSCASAGCRLVVVSQTLDDRVDVYEVPPEGVEDARWRGSLGIDLVPNVGGDISGEALDEPLGLSVVDGALQVLVGHYPSRAKGSLLTLQPSALGMLPAGEIVDTATWWRSGNPIAGAQLRSLEAREPVALLELGPGRSLVAVFNNDLFEPESGWNGATELLVVDEGEAQLGRVELSLMLGGDCRGGWGMVRLDESTVALACDGDEGVAIVDLAGAMAASDPRSAAEAVTGCFADIAFSQKRVRHLAPDGEGGVVAVESPSLATGEDARIWRFDASCALVSLGTLPGPEIWDLRQIVRVSGTNPPRWLVARGRTQARGVTVLAEGGNGVVPCGEIQGLEDLLEGGTEVVDPVSLAMAPGGQAFALGAGPTDYANAAPGHGRVAWVELTGNDVCDGETRVTDLTALGPDVDPAIPATWSRGPNEIIIVEP